MMYWYGDHVSGWGYGLGIISMILFWGLVVLVIVAAVRYLGRGGRPEPPAQHPTPPPPQASTAEQVLAERFARGEIDAEEYRRRLDVLHERTHPAATP